MRKKNAVKADSDLIGTWVSNSANYRFLVVQANSDATMRVYEFKPNGKDVTQTGICKYSLFESKLYIGSTKYKIVEKITLNTGSVTELKMKLISNNFKDTIYQVDRKMVLQDGLFYGHNKLNFYRVK